MDPINEGTILIMDFVKINLDLIIIILLLAIIIAVIIILIGNFLWRREYPTAFFRTKEDKYYSIINLGSNILGFCIAFVIILIFLLVFEDIYSNLGMK